MHKNFLIALLVIVFAPTAVFARFDRDDLDDDIVEEVPIPILFGISFDEVVSDFGAPRGGGTRSHEGQDFLVPRGTPIISPTEAVVISTGIWSGAGNYVTTANPGGETFRYMHLDYVADLDRGDKLDVGDFIGTVGDTGNAPDGAYHLHFEIRDEDNDALDPYPRLAAEFDLKDQISFLRYVFRDIPDEDEYAEHLVETYPDVFRTAYIEDWRLPKEIKEVLEDTDIEKEIKGTEDLAKILEAIPEVLTTELSSGDSGVLVSLLQIYMIYTAEGAARDRLAAAGPTGYFGSITASALIELQSNSGLAQTGVYDSTARIGLTKRLFALNLDS